MGRTFTVFCLSISNRRASTFIEGALLLLAAAAVLAAAAAFGGCGLFDPAGAAAFGGCGLFDPAGAGAFGGARGLFDPAFVQVARTDDPALGMPLHKF